MCNTSKVSHIEKNNKLVISLPLLWLGKFGPTIILINMAYFQITWSATIRAYLKEYCVTLFPINKTKCYFYLSEFN
jgi:hypothetical protein